MHFPLSELRFPLDVKMAGLQARQKFSFRYDAQEGREAVWIGGAVLLEEEYSMSYTRDAGTMEDSDWTDENSPDYKTIYSTSDAKLDASVLDLRARYYPLERKGSIMEARLGVGVGYLRQRFDYVISNTAQDEHPYNSGNQVYIPGDTLNYQVSSFA